jgi:hypothetical protein
LFPPVAADAAALMMLCVFAPPAQQHREHSHPSLAPSAFDAIAGD